MPNYYFKEVWTPLRWVHIWFYRDDLDRLWVKVGAKRRRLVGKQAIEAERDTGTDA